MEEEKRQTGGSWELSVFSRQRLRSRKTDWSIRALRLWFYHLHTQVWSNPLGRIDCSSSRSQSDHVPRANVLERKRKHGWRRDIDRWHQTNAISSHQTNITFFLAPVLFSLLVCLCGGCSRKLPQQDWDQYYSDVRHKKDIHDKSAAAMADRGFQETTNLDPLLHYKFLLLKADFASCKS